MSGPTDPPKTGWRRLARLAVSAVAVALTVVGLMLLAIAFPTLPRWVRRRITEWALRAILIGYGAVLVGSLLGLVVCGRAVTQARRRRMRLSPLVARGLLLCVANLIGLAGIEAASAGLLAWAHRLPALPIHFAPDDGRNHLVVLGGSGALGHPFSPNVSLGRIVAWQLDRALPGRPFQADVLAQLGGSLTDMHQKLTSLTQRPAAILVYSGHNEFMSRFEEERSAELDEAPRQPALHWLYRLSLGSPLCRLIYATLSKNRLDGPPPRISRHQLIDAPMFTPSEAAEVLDNFRRRLEAIVAYCERIGALPILVIEPGNEADFEPNRSLLPASASPAERRWVEDQYRAGRAAESASDPDRAVTFYRALVRRQPGFAEGHFRLARLLERAGRWKEALGHYEKARDLDGMPFRCSSEFQDVYRAVAARHPTAILVDGPAELRAICPHGIVNDDAMHDGHHASVRGLTALSRAVLRALRARRAFGWNAGAVPSLDPAEVAAHFGMDAERWRVACDWGRTFYYWTAGFRFDPAEHLARARRFDECGRRVSAGEPPDSLGFAPLSLRPLSESP